MSAAVQTRLVKNSLSFVKNATDFPDINAVSAYTDVPASDREKVLLNLWAEAGTEANSTKLYLRGQNRSGTDDKVNLENVTVSNPIASADVANKTYVDTKVNDAVQGLDIKDSCRLASSSNIAVIGTALIDGQTFDSETLSTGDRIFVKDQTTASENGIYVVQASGSTAVRATDFDTGSAQQGAFLFVEKSGIGFVLQGAAAQTVGTDALAFSQFTSSADATLSFGTNLTKTGTTVNLNNALSGITTIDASGTIKTTSGNMEAQQFISSSDRTLKQDVQYITPAVAGQKVGQMKPATYAFKARPDDPRAGVIAQELQVITPELVKVSEAGTLAVSYGDITAYLIGAIQHLQQQVETLKND